MLRKIPQRNMLPIKSKRQRIGLFTKQHTVQIKSADGVCVKQDRIIRKPKRELRISRPSVQRSSFKNNRSILSENRASELWSVRRKQLNSLQGRQEIRQSRPYRKVQPILFKGRSRPQNKRQRLLLRPQKKLPL